jgi:hypothetical protein
MLLDEARFVPLDSVAAFRRGSPSPRRASAPDRRRPGEGVLDIGIRVLGPERRYAVKNGVTSRIVRTVGTPRLL